MLTDQVADHTAKAVEIYDKHRQASTRKLLAILERVGTQPPTGNRAHVFPAKGAHLYFVCSHAGQSPDMQPRCKPR